MELPLTNTRHPFTRARIAVWGAAAAGLALAVALFVHTGIGDVVRTLEVAGWRLVWLVPLHMVPLWLSALSWRPLVTGSPTPRISYLTWATTVREANVLLPTGAIGGEIAGARLLMRRGVDLVRAAASVMVELTLWLVAQAVFAAVGLALMAGGATNSAVARFIAIGIAVGVALAGLFALTQRRIGVFSLIRRASVAIIGKDLLRRFGDAARLDAEIRALYRDRRALLTTFAFQLAALFTGALELWVALRLFGHPTGVRAVIVLASVTTAVESGAFLVPAGIGAQEGSYVLLGAAIGLSPHVALALSLAVRARQIVVGVPALVSWGWAEGKSAGARSRSRRQASALVASSTASTSSTVLNNANETRT